MDRLGRAAQTMENPTLLPSSENVSKGGYTIPGTSITLPGLPSAVPAGQAGFVAGQPVMPTGFLFEGVRWFESTNLPEKAFTATIPVSGNASAATYGAAPMLFFGMRLALVSAARTPKFC
jgi:hypothetical protein